MRKFSKLAALAGSRALTIWLLGAFIIYYITAAVWSQEALGNFVALLSGNLLVQAVYLLFLLNVALRAGSALKALWPQKFVLLCRLPLSAGVVLLLFGVFMSATMRQSTWIAVGKGDVLQLPWDGRPLRVTDIRSALQKNVLETADSLIFSSEPLVTIEDEHHVSHSVGAFPPRLVNGTYMHILNFGIGPAMELRENGKALVPETFLPLRLIPFGAVDTFQVPALPYKFSVSIRPNEVLKRGRETAREYRLEKPLYAVEVAKGDQVLARGQTDGEFHFDGRYSLVFSRPADWVLLDVAYDPFLPLFAGALLLTVAGLFFYPLSLLGKASEKR